MVIAESQGELLLKVETLKSGMGKKAEHVNLGKTKILASILNQDLLKKPEKDPCAVYLSVTGSSPIFFGGYFHECT